MSSKPPLMPANRSQPRRRRWFQFGLRTLLITVAVLAVPCAWVGYQLNWIDKRNAVWSAYFFGWEHAAEHEISRREAPGGLALFDEPGLRRILLERERPRFTRGMKSLRTRAPRRGSSTINEPDRRHLPTNLPARAGGRRDRLARRRRRRGGPPFPHEKFASLPACSGTMPFVNRHRV